MFSIAAHSGNLSVLTVDLSVLRETINLFQLSNHLRLNSTERQGFMAAPGCNVGSASPQRPAYYLVVSIDGHDSAMIIFDFFN
jgi:hypothetical protein